VKWWTAGYQLTFDTASGLKTAYVQIENVKSAECPKSRLLRMPESQELIQIVAQAATVEGVMGNPAKWPAAYYDAVTIIKRQEQTDKEAREEAINKAVMA
jgi:hypothetical protein